LFHVCDASDACDAYDPFVCLLTRDLFKKSVRVMKNENSLTLDLATDQYHSTL